mgnify:FL=1
MKKALRIVPIFLASIMLLLLTACGPSYPTKEYVVYNGSGVKIVYTGVTPNGTFGPEIKFRIENNSGYDLTVQTRKTSVNGYTINDLDAVMSIDVKNGEKANGVWRFFRSSLEENDISHLNKVVTSFHMFYMGNYGSRYLDTEIVTVLNLE